MVLLLIILEIEDLVLEIREEDKEELFLEEMLEE